MYKYYSEEVKLFKKRRIIPKHNYHEKTLMVQGTEFEVPCHLWLNQRKKLYLQRKVNLKIAKPK